MSKNNKVPILGMGTFFGYVVYEWEMSDLQGRILTLIESLGLPEKQEDAVKGLAKQAIWQTPQELRSLRGGHQEFVEKVIEDNRKLQRLNEAK